MSQRLPIGQCASLACLWEVSIPKPGNVHRGADFDDVTFLDFVTSAAAIAPAMQAAAKQPVGRTVLDAITATRRLVATNTNLGTVLLLAPLAAAPRDAPLQSGIADVLEGLDASDADLVYRAIRLAQPGGMGRVDAMDLTETPPEDLLAAMGEAAGRDLVARQYAENFGQLLSCAVPWMSTAFASGGTLADAVIHTHLRLMSEFPDSLIQRKCGTQVARESAARAQAVLDAGKPGAENYLRALADLDFWLRSDGHRRNPGTTADMIAAALFVLLRDDRIDLPTTRQSQNNCDAP